MIQCNQHAQHNTVTLSPRHKWTKTNTATAIPRPQRAVKHMDQKYVGHPERYM